MRYVTLAVVIAASACASAAWADDPFPIGPPNDPYYQQYQWDLSKIGLPAAWNYTTGSPSVTIAILDTGVVSTTADLSGRLLAPLSAVPNEAPFSDALLTSNTILRHGTYVAGVAAMGVNNGIGGAGVGNFTILPITITNRFGNNSSDWIASRHRNGSRPGSAGDQCFQFDGGLLAVEHGGHLCRHQRRTWCSWPPAIAIARIDMHAYSDLIFVSGTDQNDAALERRQRRGQQLGPIR